MRGTGGRSPQRSRIGRPPFVSHFDAAIPYRAFSRYNLIRKAAAIPALGIVRLKRVEKRRGEAMRLATLVLQLTGCLLAAASAHAHHAFATEFDVERPVALEGTVTKVELINPHSWIHIEVVGENGESATWMIEGGSPNALVRRGVTKASIPIGSELVIRGYQARDGSNRAVGRDMSFADGRELFFGGTRTPGESGESP
jgi:hypothetical protein